MAAVRYACGHGAQFLGMQVAVAKFEEDVLGLEGFFCVYGCKGKYRPEGQIAGMIERIRAHVGEGKVVAGT